MSGIQKATFAAGCFWGVEDLFMKLNVLSTTCGYTGGHTSNPTYKQVCSGETGHAEAVEIEFDPRSVKFTELLRVFYEIHDPTTLNRQGPDQGSQYRSAIFFHNQEQKELAESSKKDYQRFFSQPIVTEIQPANKFWPAEEYHQKYFKKSGIAGCHRPINKIP